MINKRTGEENHDINPSLLCVSYSTPKGYEEMIKLLKSKGLGVRELHFFDIEIPMGKSYDETINFIKRMSMPMFKRVIDVDFPFKNLLMKKIKEKTSFDLLDYDEKSWQCDFRNPAIFSGLTPVAFQNYLGTSREKELSEVEIENLKKLKNFKSDGFKNTPLEEQGIYSEEYFKERDKQKEGVL